MHSGAARFSILCPWGLASAFAAPAAGAENLAAVVHKATVEVHSAPDFKAPAIATLKRDAAVSVAGQQGLWFRVELPAGQSGFVRVNDVRMAPARAAGSSSGVRALFGGQAGKGRVTETAGVRGLDEGTLQSAAYVGAQVAALEAYRATPEAAAAPENGKAHG